MSSTILNSMTPPKKEVVLPKFHILNKNEKLEIHSAAPQFRYIVAYFMVSMLLGGKFQGKMISVHTFKKGW